VITGPVLLSFSLNQAKKMTECNENFLGGLPLTEGELRDLRIADESTKELQVKGSRCLVGRLGAPKKLNKEAFKAILMRIWRPAGRVVFKEIQENPMAV